mmetsp:Transcript_8944/g.21232  ORF Transcript_8944/g.21232 Transcript_8944/m.21232 type:complete len:215 (-) Transcript_8944:145-789(-)
MTSSGHAELPQLVQVHVVHHGHRAGRAAGPCHPTRCCTTARIVHTARLAAGLRRRRGCSPGAPRRWREEVRPRHGIWWETPRDHEWVRYEGGTSPVHSACSWLRSVRRSWLMQRLRAGGNVWEVRVIALGGNIDRRRCLYGNVTHGRRVTPAGAPPFQRYPSGARDPSRRIDVGFQRRRLRGRGRPQFHSRAGSAKKRILRCCRTRVPLAAGGF